MKKAFSLFVLTLLIVSCKNGETSDKDATLIRGEFILINDAGVIKGDDFIYGVVLNNMATQLNEKIKPLQREEYDMVPVVINGVIKKNKEEGWPEVVEITEIIGVTEPTSELPTKINADQSQKKISQQPVSEEGNEDEGKRNNDGHKH